METQTITKMLLGNGRWETAQYNERQQVTQIGLGTTDSTQDFLKLQFGYTSTGLNDNNGSMRSQTITVPAVGSNPTFSAVQTYTYDSLNRIHDAAEIVSGSQTWKQTFIYDRYGNRTFDANNTTTLGTCSTAICNPAINSANDNRFSTGQNYSYDAEGSVTQDAAGQRFGYDSESRQNTFFGANNGGGTPDATYAFDGEGRRVKNTNGLDATVFVYDAGGKLAAEYSSALAATQQVSYLTSDNLGSPRVTTNENGKVTSRKDFAPFGELVSSSQRTSGPSGNGYDTPNVRQDFTGYQKDGESGLEYAQARYYNPQHGRFTSVDPMAGSASPTDPQSLNRYTYVLNKPTSMVDPSGAMGCGAENSYRDCGGEGGGGDEQADNDRKYGGLSRDIMQGLMRRNSIDETGYDPEQDRFVDEVRISYHLDDCGTGSNGCGGVALLTQPSYSEFQSAMDTMAGSMEGAMDAMRNAGRRRQAREALGSDPLKELRDSLDPPTNTNREGLNSAVNDKVGFNGFISTHPFYKGHDIGFHAHDLGCDISGAKCIGYRSERGSMGIKGSMQIVYNQTSGAIYIDIDRFNPLQDVVNALGHVFLELGQGAYVPRPQIWDKVRSSYNR